MTGFRKLLRAVAQLIRLSINEERAVHRWTQR